MNQRLTVPYYYRIEEHDETEDDARRFVAPSDMDCFSLAEEAAEDWFARGGWESDWPLTLEIYNEDMHSMGIFVVEFVNSPYFTAKLA